MIGIELNTSCSNLIPLGMEQGIYINVTRQYVIRLLPPLIIEKSHIDFAIEKIVKIVNLVH